MSVIVWFFCFCFHVSLDKFFVCWMTWAVTLVRHDCRVSEGQELKFVHGDPHKHSKGRASEKVVTVTGVSATRKAHTLDIAPKLSGHNRLPVLVGLVRGSTCGSVFSDCGTLDNLWSHDNIPSQQRFKDAETPSQLLSHVAVHELRLLVVAPHNNHKLGILWSQPTHRELLQES